MAIPEIYFDGTGWVYRDWLGRPWKLPGVLDPEKAREAARALPIWKAALSR